MSVSGSLYGASILLMRWGGYPMELRVLRCFLPAEPVDVSKYEFNRIPCRERWDLLTREDSPLAGRDFVIPDDLAHIPLPIAKRNPVQEELRGWFGGQFESMEIIGTYNLIYN